MGNPCSICSISFYFFLFFLFLPCLVPSVDGYLGLGYQPSNFLLGRFFFLFSMVGMSG